MTLEEINKRINKDITKMDLPQSIRAIIVYLKMYHPNEIEENLYKKIIFKSNHSLSFPKSEVNYVNFIDLQNGVEVEVTLNFLSIFGSSSPLPTHYSEMVLSSFDSDKILYDFLNLFNHHLQKFIYPIWEKHRYYVQYKQDLSDRFSKYILSFLGLYTNTENSLLNFSKLIPFLGILMMKNKSSSTLETILKHYLNHENIEIIQCIKEKYIIPSFQNSLLGFNNSSLGQDFLIGEYVISRNNKFRIVLKDVDYEDLLKYSILGEKSKELDELVFFCIRDLFSYELVLNIKKENKKKFILSNNNNYLGINLWLGNSSVDEDILVIKKEKYEN